MITMRRSIIQMLSNSTVDKDQFGLNALEDRHDLDPDGDEFMKLATAHMSDVVTGRQEVDRDEIRHLIWRRDVRIIDRVTARLIAYVGVDPAIVSAISVAIDRAHVQTSWEKEVVGTPLVTMQRSNDTWATPIRVRIAEGVTWSSNGRITVPIPDTMATAAVGRRLHDVVQHPILDRYDIEIYDAVPGQTGEMELRLPLNSVSLKSLSVAEIMKMKPNPEARI